MARPVCDCCGGCFRSWTILMVICLVQASPRLRFNKDGSLLAVTASDNGIKILANRDGIQMLRAFESRAYDANRAPPEPAVSKVRFSHGCRLLCLELSLSRMYDFVGVLLQMYVYLHFYKRCSTRFIRVL